MSARLLSVFATLFLAALIAGCSGSRSSVSSYAGPSLEEAEGRTATARSVAKDAKADVKALESKIAKLEQRISRDEKRLARTKISKKSRERATTRLAENEDALKSASRELRTANRAQRRADRALRRAESRFDRAKRRQEAAAERRKEAARREAEDRKREEAARLAEENSVPIPEDTSLIRRAGTRTASLAGGLFRSNDPALKNVDDYQARVDNGFALAAIPVDKVAPRLFRQQVKYASSERPGTVIVDTGAKYLYVIERGGTAMRYGIGVGREGFAWSGSAHIGFKRQWPKWTPPVEMIERQPELAKYCADCGGMPGGPANPLGARALYLVKDGKDTLYRLHGTPKWNSIGTAASSGCIRLMNQDVIDLYERVPTGSKVIVI